MKNGICWAAAAVLASGCASMAPSGTKATARLEPTKGNTANGTVTFTQKGNKVAVDARVAGLTPDHHAGDVPMLVADSSGNATLVVELDVMTIGSGETDIVCRGLIVHKDPDDFTTQPTGNAAARVACAVITRS